MPRGKLRDDLTFGPARRRRRMMRRLAELDRADAAGCSWGSPPRRRSDLPRRLMVGLTTVLVVTPVTAVALDRQWGIELRLDGVHRRAPLGTPPEVATGLGPFSFTSTQRSAPDEPVSYDPCRPVDIVVNDAQAPRGSEGVVKEAVLVVSAATGLQLRVVGATDEPADIDRPRENQARYGPGWSPVLVGWTNPGEVPRLGGDIAGLGGSLPSATSLAGRSHYVTGAVWLDSPQLTEVLSRPNGRNLVRAIVMHELGHLVGLDHVKDPGELMYEDNVGRLGFGPGDREGLAALGRGRCG